MLEERRSWLPQRWCILCPLVQNLLNKVHKKQAQVLTINRWIPICVFLVALTLVAAFTVGLMVTLLSVIQQNYSFL